VSKSISVFVIVLLCAMFASAQKITKDFFGLATNKTSHFRGQQSPWPDECCKRESIPFRFGVWRSLGSQVNWNQLSVCQPTNGADPNDHCYFWDKIDGYLRQVAAHGEDTIYTVYDTPAWANLGEGTNHPPADVQRGDQDLKNFLTALHRHVSSKGWHIKYWECWNEPDVSEEYAGTPQDLFTMCRDIKSTIHPLDPDAKFISPGFTSTSIIGRNNDDIDPKACSGRDCSLMQRYLVAGGGQYADIIGYHGYGFPDPVDPYFSADFPKGHIKYNVPHLTDVVNEIVSRTGNQGKPIWMTEGSCFYPRAMSSENEDMRAACFARYMLQFMGRGTSLVVWWGWDFGGANALLSDRTGIPDDRLNKGGRAFVQIYKWTVEKGASMTQPCSPKGTTYTCTLTDEKGNTMLAMYDTSQECKGSPVVCPATDKSVPQQYTKWTDLDGVSHKIANNTVPVSRRPILLEAASEEPPQKR